MSGDRSVMEDMRCIAFVNAISAYLDGEVDDELKHRMDAHLGGCAGCRAAIDQFESVIRLTGRLSPDDVADTDPLIRDRLMATLRTPRRR